MGGIGKTPLAVETAHRARAEGWFPGGTLFVDLRGYDTDPVTADQAVLALLARGEPEGCSVRYLPNGRNCTFRQSVILAEQTVAIASRRP
jgi:hypothetical protein